jgi:hypothetical protein
MATMGQQGATECHASLYLAGLYLAGHKLGQLDGNG